MPELFPTSDLEAYLDEALPPEAMARIEKAAREDPELLRRLAGIHARRDAGVHSLGEIWRRHRLSCPPREQLAAHLRGDLAEGPDRFVTFHVEVAGCRLCQANLADFRHQAEVRQAEPPQTAQARRHKFFQSSAGYLRQQ